MDKPILTKSCLKQGTRIHGKITSQQYTLMPKKLSGKFWNLYHLIYMANTKVLKYRPDGSKVLQELAGFHR